MFDDFDALLATRPDPVAALANRLRTAAAGAMPDLTERFYPRWEGLGLRHPSGGLLGTLFANESHVVVYFERGAAMPDPAGLLEGVGRLRQTRTITFTPSRHGPKERVFVEYLDLALEHAMTRTRR
jgi:hypothetical protein